MYVLSSFYYQNPVKPISMAKKTVTAPPAATPAAPKSTKQANPNLPCALQYYWQFALLGWGHCKSNLSRFSAESPRYTEQFVDEQIAFIKEMKALPDLASRAATPRGVLLALKGARQSVSDMAARLDKAINYSFKEATVAAAQRSAAGLVGLAEASLSDWAAASRFIETANTYLAANLQKLVDAGAVNPDFATNFASVGVAFDGIWNDLQAKRQKATDGTKAVADGIQRIKAELNPMFQDAALYFKYEPALRQLFTQDYLLSQVRSGKTAGIRGRIAWASDDLPIAGVLVEVLNFPGKTATTNAKGRYALKIAAGEYRLRFTSPGTAPFEQQVTVTAGISRRVNVTLAPMVSAPMVSAPMVERTPILPNDTELSSALKDILAPTNGQSTQAAVLNGVH